MESWCGSEKQTELVGQWSDLRVSPGHRLGWPLELSGIAHMDNFLVSHFSPTVILTVLELNWLTEGIR